MPTNLSLAVALFPLVCPTDYQGPIELFSFLSPELVANPQGILSTAPDTTVKVTYLGVTSDPIQGGSGPRVLPDKTYSEVLKDGQQFDVILVPGGIGTRPGVLPEIIPEFVKTQAPGAKYILSVCTGAEVLAKAGVLDGLRATTNKSLYKDIEERYKAVKWVPKARWVVDGKFWTASGVTAGADMGYAFLVHLVGEKIATDVRGIVELSVRKQDDDEFAEFYRLV